MSKNLNIYIKISSKNHLLQNHLLKEVQKGQNL